MGKYDRVIPIVARLLKACNDVGLGDQLPKGGISAILLANHLSHEVVQGDKGADGKDSRGNLYEYKVSIKDKFNFHCGTRTLKSKDKKSIAERLGEKFRDFKGAYCAARSGACITDVVYCDFKTLLPHLIEHFELCDGEQLNKQFSLQEFSKIPGAKRIKLHPKKTSKTTGKKR
jgi:hypothetical protein